MNTTTIALTNGALALLMLSALALVLSLGLRIHKVSNEQSRVAAEPTPLDLHDEQLARAA